jgi:lysylphosphatidylglycerol synthetase-like protein (DUF2156 family)
MTSIAKPSPFPTSQIGCGQREHAEVIGVLARHADNPSAFLAVNDGTRHFRVPEIDGVIAYRPAGRRTLVQFGGVFADGTHRAALLAAFLAFAARQRRRVVAVQLMAEDATLYSASGFTVNQLGADYARELAGFTLAGKKHMQLRNKISRARRAGLRVVELTAEQADEPAMADQLRALDRSWLRSKGRHVKELEFMVGQRGGPAQPARRLFVAVEGAGSVQAYVSFSPVFGPRSGWLHDLSRRRPDAAPGALELIVSTVIDQLRAEGSGYLHFGFTPFTGLSAGRELPGASPVAARLIRLLAERGAVVYPAADQLAYKQKWGLDVIEPEYVAFHGGISLRSIWGLLRLTNAA